MKEEISTGNINLILAAIHLGDQYIQILRNLFDESDQSYHFQFGNVGKDLFDDILSDPEKYRNMLRINYVVSHYPEPGKPDAIGYNAAAAMLEDLGFRIIKYVGNPEWPGFSIGVNNYPDVKLPDYLTVKKYDV